MNDSFTTPALRLLDANFNRAREGLRVLEDYARFILDDVTLTERGKNTRHQLLAAIQPLFPQPAALYRDTTGDVGTALTNPSEQTRTAIQDVLQAAGNRVSEALRTLEEFSKLHHPEAAPPLEQLRYTTYTFTAQLLRRVIVAERFCPVRLYALLTAELCRYEWRDTAARLLAGGVQAIQLREKKLSDRELLERAGWLTELCHAHHALCIINDRVDIALAAGADGVHLGQDNLPLHSARRLAGPQLLIGWSSHSIAQAKAALADPPDYLAVGPMFASTTKPQTHLAGPETLQAVRALTSLPLVAIGGVDVHNAAQLSAANALAVCSALLQAADPIMAAQTLMQAMTE
ncbi:MAG: Thiamine-phosphate synthase [Phycisphaerae bacterium]|nr:Thiamine-phosphate synthase [Phycisphaerae bacterium]